MSTERCEFLSRALRVLKSGVASFEVERCEFEKSGVTNLIAKRYER